MKILKAALIGGALLSETAYSLTPAPHRILAPTLEQTSLISALRRVQRTTACDKLCVDTECVDQFVDEKYLGKDEAWLFEHIHACTRYVNFMRRPLIRAAERFEGAAAYQ